ncbi:MAG: large-conductance mechanosensitive channel protein MscL [Ruminiclostridium sp.]|nr:large-conductance mechanosensitive channel protein MscL [Ruminiclostridium sp.]
MEAPTKKARGFFAEFKEFINRGNVIDMAVGVIIATAFGKITTSLVNDVVMPVIGYIFGGTDLSKLDIILKPEVVDQATKEVLEPAVCIGIGTFLTTIIDFLLVALVVFCVIKAINSAKDKAEARRKKEAEEAAEAPAEPSAEEKLLTEIRDLLKDQQKQ